MRTAEVHSRALASWRELPHSVQLRWNEYAREIPSHRLPFDGRGHITGHNLFVSAYHGFAQMGNEHVPEPVKWQPFPVFALEYARCESATGDSLKLRFRLSLPDAESPERYRVLAKVQVGKPGCGKDSSKMRNALSESVPCDEVSEVTFFVSSAEIYAPPFQIHMRYLLLDTKTGYRSQYVALSTRHHRYRMNRDHVSSAVARIAFRTASLSSTSTISIGFAPSYGIASLMPSPAFVVVFFKRSLLS